MSDSRVSRPAHSTEQASGALRTQAPVVILGGYGAVGAKLARILDGQAFPTVIAGRNGDRAQALATELRHARALRIELPTQFDRSRLAAAGATVVNCAGLESVEVAESAVSQGLDFVDISASAGYLSKLEALGNTACQAGCRVLTNVGLAPGLTGVLAVELIGASPSSEWIEIICLLGVGERAGAASRDWTLGKLGDSFVTPSGERVRNFSQPRVVELPEGFGRRRAYRFDFPEQHLLAEDLGVRIINRFCFDSRAVTSLVAAAGRLRVLGRLVHAFGIHLGPTPWAGESWVGVVEGSDGSRLWASGENQAFGTAAVVAVAVGALARQPAGVHRLHEIAGARELGEGLKAHDIQVSA